MFNKKFVDKYTKLCKPNDNILESNYCLSVPDNDWELLLFVREYPMPAILKSIT